MPASAPSLFQRLLLPGLAFKGVVIGGGYATGRELVEFFLGSGPRGGVAGILLAAAIWSAVCTVAFLFARATAAYDYRSFFKELLGRFWRVFEIVYLLLLILILSVVAAAAGEIGAHVFGLPLIAGTLLLIGAVVGVTSFGNRGAEQLFKYASGFIYLTYAIFLALALTSFGDRIADAFATEAKASGWLLGGMTYASYNVVAVVAVLPFVRHMTSRRDAIVAGMLAGPLAMLPALLLFLCMISFYPMIGDADLPSGYLLQRMHAPWFQILFQSMMFCALVETGVGVLNAVNERVAETIRDRGASRMPQFARFAISASLLIGSTFVAARVGLVELIARGYGLFGYIVLIIFILPLFVVGVARIRTDNRSLAT